MVSIKLNNLRTLSLLKKDNKMKIKPYFSFIENLAPGPLENVRNVKGRLPILFSKHLFRLQGIIKHGHLEILQAVFLIFIYTVVQTSPYPPPERFHVSQLKLDPFSICNFLASFFSYQEQLALKYVISLYDIVVYC